MKEPQPLPTLIVYGNCQAEAVSVIFNLNPVLSSHYAIRYVPSYDTDNARFASLRLSDEDLASCTLLCEQYDRNDFPLRERLPAGAATLTFPSIDCNVLWPFNASNPYNPPEPKFPFGRFPYGDRVIIGQIDAGTPAAKILDYYLNGWDEYKVDLARFLQIEEARVAARDAKCDVKMGAYLFERFRAQRPLWTANHPTRGFLTELVERILKAALPLDKRFATVNIGDTVERNFVLSPRGPLGIVSVPIHPKVAEYYELSWYDPSELYPVFDGTSYGYEQYFREMIKRSIAAKRASDAAKTT